MIDLLDLLFRLVFVGACVYFALKINRACDKIDEVHRRITQRRAALPPTTAPNPPATPAAP